MNPRTILITGGEAVIGPVVGGSSRELVHLRGRGRAAATFPIGWRWVTVEGPVRIAGPDNQLEGVSPPQRSGPVRAVFRSASGSHDDWDQFDRVMAAERRTAVVITRARVITSG